jgi:hypothetical protein
VAVLPETAPLAPGARDVVLDEDAVSLRETLALGEGPPGPGDDADVLVPHDDRVAERRCGVHLDVGAADASDLNLEQRTVVRDIRHGELAELGRAWTGPHCRQHMLGHDRCSSPLSSGCLERY